MLGDTLEQIASEKAGILKAGVPAVVARLDPEAAKAVGVRAEAADEIGDQARKQRVKRQLVAEEAADPLNAKQHRLQVDRLDRNAGDRDRQRPPGPDCRGLCLPA